MANILANVLLYSGEHLQFYWLTQVGLFKDETLERPVTSGGEPLTPNNTYSMPQPWIFLEYPQKISEIPSKVL